jgi:hypothetical protein
MSLRGEAEAISRIFETGMLKPERAVSKPKTA